MRSRISNLCSDYDINEFAIQETLDKGGFGEVRKALHRKSNTVVAIKRVQIDQAVVDDFQSSRYHRNCSYLLREWKILKRCRGNQFAKFYGVCWEGLGTVYFILELLTKKSLYNLWRFQLPFFEDEVQFFAGCILLGLEKMHQRNIVHKDLKLNNVMIGEDGYPRIIDFGLSRIQKSDQKLTEDPTSGTLQYKSPEEVSSGRYGTEVDLWALGAMMYEMIVGMPPFTYRHGEKKMKESIKSSRFKVPEFMTSEATDLIKALLQPNPDDRIQIRDIKKHPFFEGIDFAKLETKEFQVPFFVTNL